MGNANSYYNRVADYNPDELADGDTIEDEFNAVQRGFESVEIAIETIESEKANKSSPTFTGTPAAPTAVEDTNTTQLATTAFVVGQAATVAPAMDGVAAVGTSKKFARQDHVHPTDTSRAPVASPDFTGTPSAPTAEAGTNTTQLATTEFVANALYGKASISDLQKGVYSFATDTGIANAYICKLTPALDERREGQVIRFKVANSNNGACTVNDGIGVVPLVGLALSALQGGEMVAGSEAWIQWHSTVGTGSYVLLFCSGAPLQISNANKSHHAVAKGQVVTADVMSNFSAYKTASQAITASTITALTFQSERFDDTNEYSTSTGKFTAVNDGTYVFYAGAHGSTANGGDRILMLYVNGVERIRMQESFGTAASVTIAGTSGPVNLSAGDYVQVYYEMLSYNDVISTTQSYFAGMRIK